MIRHIFFFFIFLLAGSVFSQDVASLDDTSSELLVSLIMPTSDSIDRYVIMQPIPKSASEYEKTFKIINTSSVKDILRLYGIAQNYLINLGKLDGKAPAYLALTNNQGGYAKTGFYLLADNGDTIAQKGTSFVDIKLSNIMGNQDRLMSFTQLYPHELGHIIYSMIALNEYVDPNDKNVDMHYFPVITNYSTAFNEGFAEQFENLSRIIEDNDSIRKGIERDVERIEGSSEQWIGGYIRDFKYPVRIGFYKSSVINWFQKYEDFRRFMHTINPDVKYVYTSPELSNIEDRLTIRNAGIMTSGKIKNSVQLMATEGVIAAFLTQMLISDLPYHYLNKDFYKVFLADSSNNDFIPENTFSTFENQFIKNYYVLHNYVSKWNSDKNQFSDFIKGYIKSFPNEEYELMKIYKNVTGSSFNYDIPEQIWLMVKGHNHRVIAIDPFGAITIPVYTFDLNAAEIEDLLTIPGMNEEMAESIIKSRDENGLFRELDDLKTAIGISDKTADLLIQSKFDKDYFSTLSEPELNFSAIIYTPLKWILFKSGAYMILFIIILNVFFISSKVSKSTRRIWISIRYILWWILLFSSLCAIIVMTSNPILYSSIVLGAALVISSLVFVKNKSRLRRTIVMTLLMSLVLILSVG
ncbi:ComEA family DNA-binding protein [Bacteroidota bacterium]